MVPDCKVLKKVAHLDLDVHELHGQDQIPFSDCEILLFSARSCDYDKQRKLCEDERQEEMA